jgi:oxaloacetate decarboxylase beta subunit
MIENLLHYLTTTGFTQVTMNMVIMWAIVGILLYLAVAKGFEPLLLIPISFGAFIANLPTRGVFHPGMGTGDIINSLGHAGTGTMSHVGLFDIISQGIHLELFPPIIFLGVGALTDFGPLIANPRTLLLGAAAQAGIFITFIAANMLGFTSKEAASIGIIGGADGPTAIFTTINLAPHLLGPIAVAAYSYMSLVPLIQPPIMKALTTDKERRIKMKSLRQVSRLEKLLFCLFVTLACVLLVPDASALIAMLMLGNFLRECGVTDRLVKAAQNEIINVVTIFLGASVGITMSGDTFLQPQTLKITLLGVVAFGFATAAGVLMAKVMNLLSKKNPINPLIGSAGVSAVPMAARVSQIVGQKADPNNFLLMHAMGPNVAGVIGTAVAAGYLISSLR